MRLLFGVKKIGFSQKSTTRSPDLALEIDISSRTHPETYAALGVSELWRRANNRIRTYQLQETDGKAEYQEVEQSQIFPGWPLAKALPQYITQSKVEGRNKAMRSFRQWVRRRLC